MRSSGGSDLGAQSTGGRDPAPAKQKSPTSIKTGDGAPPSPSKAAGVESQSVMAMDEDGGEVVVFQLLMQRFELRPWVVAPRTLVASKEQVGSFLGGAGRLFLLLICIFTATRSSSSSSSSSTSIYR